MDNKQKIQISHAALLAASLAQIADLKKSKRLPNGQAYADLKKKRGVFVPLDEKKRAEQR